MIYMRRLLMITERSERGATATEYGLLLSFIALALVTAVLAFGNALSAMFDGFVTVLTGVL
jgi:pilus assembly protein Flp/PilA